MNRCSCGIKLLAMQQIRPLAKHSMVDMQFLSLNVLGARPSSPSGLLFLDLVHDAFLLGNDFWRQAFDECFIGQDGGGLG